MVHLIEFWDYLVQFLVCTAGFIGGGKAVLEKPQAALCFAGMFFWTYALGTLY